jgi:hypothetical protein
MIDNEASVN